MFSEKPMNNVLYYSRHDSKKLTESQLLYLSKIHETTINIISYSLINKAKWFDTCVAGSKHLYKLRCNNWGKSQHQLLFLHC